MISNSKKYVFLLRFPTSNIKYPPVIIKIGHRVYYLGRGGVLVLGSRDYL